MLNLSLRHESSTLTAGLFREKVGIIENPLFVTPNVPEKVVTFAVVSLWVCDSAVEQSSMIEIERMRFLDILHRFYYRRIKRNGWHAHGIGSEIFWFYKAVTSVRIRLYPDN